MSIEQRIKDAHEALVEGVSETPPPGKHPARFSPELIVAFRKLIPPRSHVHDPFAGTGERLGALCDELGCVFTGTEIEKAFIVDPRVIVGDATVAHYYTTCQMAATRYYGSFLGPGAKPEKHVLVTSPVYPNGMADDWDMQDGSRRMTYRSAKRSAGDDTPLHHNNQGRYGYRGTKRSKRSQKRWAYWRIAGRAAVLWGWRSDLVLLNVSDFMYGNGQVEPVTDTWIGVLFGAGMDVTEVIDVKTRRNRDGANGEQRMDAEHIIIAKPRSS